MNAPPKKLSTDEFVQAFVGGMQPIIASAITAGVAMNVARFLVPEVVDCLCGHCQGQKLIFRFAMHSKDGKTLEGIDPQLSPRIVAPSGRPE